MRLVCRVALGSGGRSIRRPSSRMRDHETPTTKSFFDAPTPLISPIVKSKHIIEATINIIQLIKRTTWRRCHRLQYRLLYFNYGSIVLEETCAPYVSQITTDSTALLTGIYRLSEGWRMKDDRWEMKDEGWEMIMLEMLTARRLTPDWLLNETWLLFIGLWEDERWDEGWRMKTGGIP